MCIAEPPKLSSPGHSTPGHSAVGFAGFRAATLTFTTISGFNPAIRFADIVETASADRAAQARFMSPEVNARQRVCALGRETVWR